jgi:hypothetical protein
MRSLIAAALLVLVVAVPAHAQYGYPAPPTPLRSFMDGFALTAGFQWENPDNEDLGLAKGQPFFVGGELRLPLAPWVDVAGNLDREFVAAPHWKSRLYLSAKLWRRP